jgi:hypothetical protein
MLFKTPTTTIAAALMIGLGVWLFGHHSVAADSGERVPNARAGGMDEKGRPSVISGGSATGELNRIERKLGREPVYASKAPKYCLLVFGPKAETRVWLVLDLTYDPLREIPGKTESLYADLDGNGDLVDVGERISVTVVTRKASVSLKFADKDSEHDLHLPQFRVGDVTSRDGKTVYRNLVVDVGWYVPGRRDREVTVAVDVPGQGRQSVGGEQLWFGTTATNAPIIWFDGALTMRPAPSGMLHCPIDYSGKEPPPPWYEEFPLVRGQKMSLRAELGSAGIGVGTFSVLPNNKAPQNVHPVAKVVFRHKDPKQPAIEVSVELNQRCCGTLFKGLISVPEEAALGKAKITYSFPAWVDRKVQPAVGEIGVADTDTRPKIFREP